MNPSPLVAPYISKIRNYFPVILRCAGSYWPAGVIHQKYNTKMAMCDVV